MEEIAVKVEHVSKDFILPHEKVTSLKGAFTGMFRHTKSREIQHALKDINFEITKGEFFGIVGRNGSGKSTLLKVLAGIYQPTKGNVRVVGKLVPFIELGVGFNPELTGRENVYLNGAMLGFSDKEIDAMYQDIVAFAELERFMDQKLKNYSSGMQVRLAFSMATRSEADILLVDEVLAVGDADFQRKCFDYFKQLKKNHKTVIFVSHDMDAVREYCDRAALIENSELLMVGDSEKIATAYTKLFMEDSGRNGSLDRGDDKEKRRWGNQAATFKAVKAEIVGDQVVVTGEAELNKNLSKFMYGMHIIAPDGKEVTATNNRLIFKKDAPGGKTGDKITIKWNILNIFASGNYSVTLTLVNTNGEVYDWFEEAATFRVRREERSTTAIIPPMDVQVSSRD